MAAAFYPDPLSHDRLGFAFCLALALHAAIILGVSFSREPRALAPARLDITLAQHRSDEAPEQADFLAQNNQQGSGTLKEKAMLTTREQADFADTTIREVNPQQRQASSPAQGAQKPVLQTRGDSNTKAPTLSERQPRESSTDLEKGDVSILERSLEIASLEAKLDIQQQAYAKRPRIRRLTSVATQASADALYLHQWRSRIEAIGNKNYPIQARQQSIFGELRLMVALLPNGEVYEIKILASSGHKVLDEAAIRIVHLAAPYDPFPPAMRREVDVLEIIRTWRFHNNQLSSSS